ncbi:MAG: thiamine pyrophosphate-dependent enzyme, partial [Verrucomicrobiae bacterium]|nr:thiamine pyrophosphate-dependent enzyme [Verrucomicrobiae bacterium]
MNDTPLAPPAAPAAPYKKTDLKADRPTWCPGCGDFSVLEIYLRLCEKRQVPREKITSVAGIGCSSRFPYFVRAHGAHFIHGRAVAFASGLSLSRPDLHVFVFSGDGDAFSIGGNHVEHAARKNIHMTLVVMDNFVYGLTKKQTSPTSPIGFKSKTDPAGVMDKPTNPLKKLIAAGATFVARGFAKDPRYLADLIGKALLHRGYALIDVLQPCVTFNRVNT